MQPEKKVITIGDVARFAGVSVSTVSRVLTGNVPVSAKKKATILDAVRELGYRPNPAARDLANGTSMSIGVAAQFITSPYYGEILRGVTEGLQDSKYSFMIFSGNEDKESFFAALERLDALIVLREGISDGRLRELARKMPTIIIGHTVSGIEDSCIHIDNFQPAYKAMQYLISMGHERIVHICGIDCQDTTARQAGYSQALQDAGLPLDPRLIIQGDFTEHSAVLTLEQFLSQQIPFTAIFAANDQMAQGALMALYRYGLRVPEDISLVGFDDLPFSAVSYPPLTTVRQPLFEMGLTAARAILAKLDGQEPTFPMLKPNLIIRASTMSLHMRCSVSADAHI